MKYRLGVFLIIATCTVSIACSGESDSSNGAQAVVVATKTDVVEDTSASLPGKAVYDRNCVACHQSNGKGIPPAFPAIAGSAVVLGDIDAQISLILNGVSGTAMVAFGPQLNDEDIAAVVTYQRNAFGNATGDVVTAEQVAALR